MMRIKNRLNILKIKLNADWKKISAGIVLFAMALSTGWYLLPANTFANYGSAPRFNIFTPYTYTQTYNQDYHLLSLRNETKGIDWTSPVSADPGDIIMMSVYYHNGVNYTTAHNTTLKVNVPDTVGTQIVPTAYLWADNAENATYSNPFTGTATVNISSPQKLEFISGSVKWYPNQTDWRYDAPTPLPGGQSGDSIVTTGVNIGDAIGCWEFSGYINFKVKVSKISYVADLTIEKKVRNITESESSYQKSTAAKPRQKVSFQIIVRSTGDAEAKNVIIRDQLPDRLIYVPGSTKVDGQPVSDGIIYYSGINVGTIPKSSSKTITFEADVEKEVKFERGETLLTNTAFARADSISEKSDTALVTVLYSGCSPQVNVPGKR